MYEWDAGGLELPKEAAYADYKRFHQDGRAYRLELSGSWAKKIYAALGTCACSTRPRVGGGRREERLMFAGLDACRAAFAKWLNAPAMRWDDEAPGDIFS